MTAYALGFALLFVFFSLLILLFLCLVAMESVGRDVPDQTTGRVGVVAVKTTTGTIPPVP